MIDRYCRHERWGFFVVVIAAVVSAFCGVRLCYMADIALAGEAGRGVVGGGAGGRGLTLLRCEVPVATPPPPRPFLASECVR